MATPATTVESRRPKIGDRFNPCEFFSYPSSEDDWEELTNKIAHTEFEARHYKDEIDSMLLRYNDLISTLEGLCAQFRDLPFMHLVEGKKHLYGVYNRRNQDRRNSRISKLGTKYSWRCVYCHQPGDSTTGPDKRYWHIDHIYPRALGGDNKPDNLVLSCATCNLQKGTKFLTDMMAEKVAS